VRLAGPWSVTVFGHTIGELFWPGVVFPGLFFTIVAAWPFVEARVTGDHDEHHFLQRSREMPLRSAVGAAGLTLMSILTIAGSNDVMARLFDVEVDQLNVWLRWGLLVLPLAVAFVVFRACRELGERDVHPVSRPKRLEVRWSQTGGFEESEDATEPASTAPERSEP
jgi:ubiquinol-cytochrome c reductase cytochrome b subunit